jgi:hypothetical protein
LHQIKIVSLIAVKALASAIEIHHHIAEGAEQKTFG